MAEETEKINENNEDLDYIEVIKNMQEKINEQDNMIGKIKEEKKKLLTTLVNNGKAPEEEQKPREIDTKAIVERLSSKDPTISSLEGFQMALDLREADLAAGKTDPFISANEKSPTQADYDAAQRRAEIYQECIDYANGDTRLFAQELQRRMVDTYIPTPGARKTFKK